MTLKQLRESKNLTQKQIAFLLCYTKDHYSELERNPETLKQITIIILSNIFNVAPSTVSKAAFKTIKNKNVVKMQIKSEGTK